MNDDAPCSWCGEPCEGGACTCDLPGGEVRLGAGMVKAGRIKTNKGKAKGFTTRTILVRKGSKSAPGRGRMPFLALH